MSTLDQLTSDLTTAMKARDTERTGILRQIIGAVRFEAKAGAVEKELSEDDVLKILAREVKKRRDSAQIYTDAGAAERAATETTEADLIETYLPAQLSDDELAALVKAVIADVGASSVRDMGAVMKEATARAGASRGRQEAVDAGARRAQLTADCAARIAATWSGVLRSRQNSLPSGSARTCHGTSRCPMSTRVAPSDEQALELGGLVGAVRRPQVGVQPVLDGLHVRDLEEQPRGGRAVGRPDLDLLVVVLRESQR